LLGLFTSYVALGCCCVPHSDRLKRLRGSCCGPTLRLSHVNGLLISTAVFAGLAIISGTVQGGIFMAVHSNSNQYDYYGDSRHTPCPFAFDHYSTSMLVNDPTTSAAIAQQTLEAEQERTGMCCYDAGVFDKFDPSSSTYVPSPGSLCITTGCALDLEKQVFVPTPPAGCNDASVCPRPNHTLQCGAGFQPVSHEHCLLCAAGQFSADGRACLDCPAGQHADRKGQAACAADTATFVPPSVAFARTASFNTRSFSFFSSKCTLRPVGRAPSDLSDTSAANFFAGGSKAFNTVAFFSRSTFFSPAFATFTSSDIPQTSKDSTFFSRGTRWVAWLGEAHNSSNTPPPTTTN
jgi:hypothetical protein